MKVISIDKIEAVFKNIQQHQKKHEELTNILNKSGYGNLMIDCGGNLLDILIDLLEDLLNDKENIIEWYIFENRFGKNKLIRKINGKKVSVGSVKELLNLLCK